MWELLSPFQNFKLYLSLSLSLSLSPYDDDEAVDAVDRSTGMLTSGRIWQEVIISTLSSK